MPRVTDFYSPPGDLVLGERINSRVPEADQKRQRIEVDEILNRFRKQPGVVLADEVGMGKTYVALAVAYCFAVRSPRGPVIVMVPPNLVDKWQQDLKTFCELYLDARKPILKDGRQTYEVTAPDTLRYGIARHSIDLMKLLDDPARERCHLIFLAQGAMARSQTDKWVRLALIAECLRRHGRGGATRLIQVKKQIHRFLAELLWALGEERAHDWGDELWHELLRTDTSSWKEIYNASVKDEKRKLTDDPVPKSVVRALNRSDVDLSKLAAELKYMPVRARGGGSRVSERLNSVRRRLRETEEELWKMLLAQARWRSPLLVMDEAHHLKNPATSLARQLQSLDSERDLKTGDGAMANAFDRMLFLTATPFQLGHHELVNVLRRFGDVRWDTQELDARETFLQQLADLGKYLDATQRCAIRLQRCWMKMEAAECSADIDVWWDELLKSSREALLSHQRSVVDAYQSAKQSRDLAEEKLRPWIVRHNKGEFWGNTGIIRRQRYNGGAVAGNSDATGISIPPQQLLPFFLAARSAIKPGQDLLGEALSSSYEAFRFTRQNRDSGKDSLDEASELQIELSRSRWYMEEFDRALSRCSGFDHPKVFSTVRKAVDLWETGEKVLIFAFYRYTCRALRIHISREIERRTIKIAQERLAKNGQHASQEQVDRVIGHIQDRFFDKAETRGRRAIDAALNRIIADKQKDIDKADMTAKQCDSLVDIMRRFLRVPTTLARFFPMAEFESMNVETAIETMLNTTDASGVSWRDKFHSFIVFLTDRCPTEDERNLYLNSVDAPQTGRIRVMSEEDEDGSSAGRTLTVANVRVATGKTKRDDRVRLMRAFNTPFFPDILVCSEVMGEGVDLQWFCRHVIHHDLAWNPSTIEQRTGRVDRLGCKAEERHPILIFLPYLAGTADERQYCVMRDREQWFRIVMGQDEVAKLITTESTAAVALPKAISLDLSFRLGLDA